MADFAALAKWMPLAVLAIAFLTTMAVLALWRRRSVRRGIRNPLSQELLRSPGESLRDRIAGCAWDASEYAVLGVFLLPLLVLVFGVARVSAPEYAAAAALLQAWILFRLWRVLARSKKLTLEYEAELAAGQELDGLGPYGYRVFHDVPVRGPEASVDHIVVGPAGVFAVETKGRTSGRLKANGADPWEVTYDGESLKFPGSWWRERAPLAEAVTQAVRVSQWLSSAVGESVPVNPVLVLPGWYVRRTAISGIPVLGARRVQYYFGKKQLDWKLSSALVERIASQLDERCRTKA